MSHIMCMELIVFIGKQKYFITYANQTEMILNEQFIYRYF